MTINAIVSRMQKTITTIGSRLGWSLFVCWLAWPVLAADDPPVVVEVSEAYLDLRTGPGDSYPRFQIAERGEKLQVLGQRTGWFRVRTAKDREGWVSRQQMERTLVAPGVFFHVDEQSQDSFLARRWEMGVLAGDFAGDRSITLYGGYALTPVISAELSLAQVLGDFSDSLLLNVDLLMQPFQGWRVSPFFAIGSGVINTQARKTVVNTRDSTDPISHVAVGVRAYLARRFVLRAEYRNHVIFTNHEDNKEIDEWRAGLAFFF